MQIFEVIMLICFGLSWPVSVFKSVKSKSTKGKSVIFLFAILLGYVSGVVGKIVNDQINYVLILYCVNFAVVLVDTVLYFINRSREKTTKEKKQKTIYDNNEMSLKVHPAVKF